MARDDWRLRIELGEEGAGGLLGRLGLSEAHHLATDLEEHRLEASDDGGTVFVYAGSSLQLEQARSLVEQELVGLGITPISVSQAHWLHAEERWSDEPLEDATSTN
jgi:hypothetical protein